MARPADPNLKIDLLAAAEEVFVARGVDRAKVEDITARAGRSKGAFYQHFDSKEDAFREIVETVLARLTLILDRRTTDEGAPMDAAEFLARWQARDVALLEFVWQNRGVMRLALSGGRSAAFSHLIDTFAQRAYRVAHAGIVWGVEEGAFRAELDVDIASLALAGAYDRVVRTLVDRAEQPDLTAWVRSLHGALLQGLATQKLTTGGSKITGRRGPK